MANDRLLGRVLGRYRIESVIGRGGMGVVYRARDERLERVVALKVLSDERAADAGFRERFLRESRLLASLDHPNIVPVFEADEMEGELFIAMRLVQGPELGRIIERDGPLAPSRAVAIIAQVADALDAAHATGLVHRDIKPANVLVVSGPSADHAYLTDFGLTKVAGASTGLTQAGQFVGTPGYVSPEQIQGRGVDHRSDVYALGCVLYDCLTGVVPFPRDSTMASLWAHVHEVPPRPSESRPGLPAAFDEVIAKALAKQPGDRYQTAGGLALAARKAIPVSAADATTVADTPAAFLSGAGAAAAAVADEPATALAADSSTTELTPRQSFEASATHPAAPPTSPAVDPGATVVGPGGTSTVAGPGAPPTIGGGGYPPTPGGRSTTLGAGDSESRPWRKSPILGLSAAFVAIVAVSGLALGSGLIDLTGDRRNPGPTGTAAAGGPTEPPIGGTPEPVASVDPSGNDVVSFGPSAAPLDSTQPSLPVVNSAAPDPVTPKPVTPRPVTPKPVTPKPVTPRPATPRPATPRPATPRPATPTPGPVNKAPVAVADPITFASSSSHQYYYLALMDNDTDSDGINDTIYYYDWQNPDPDQNVLRYGVLSSSVYECPSDSAYAGQYCLRYEPNYSGAFTDYFYYRISDNPGEAVSNWGLVTLKFNS